MMKTIYCAAVGTIGGVLCQLFGQLFGQQNIALYALAFFMALDFVSGWVVAGVFKASRKSKGGALESRASVKGLYRKGGMLVVVLVAAVLSLLTDAPGVRDAVISFFVANEALSVVENVGLMGVKIPPRLMKAIDVLKSKSEYGDKPDDT